MFDSITDFFSGGQQKGYQSMEEMLRQGLGKQGEYTDKANGLMNPFYQAGQGQINPYMQNYGRMLDPHQFYNDMLKGYEMTPAAQNQMRQGTDSAMNAASASGLMGSSSLLNNVNKMSQDITRGDQQHYLDNMMGIYNQGLGHQQGMVGTGMNAGNIMGQNYMNQGRSAMDAYGNMGQAQMGSHIGQQRGLMNMFDTLGGGMDGWMKDGGWKGFLRGTGFM